MKYNGIDTDKIMRNGERVRGHLNGKDLETGIVTDGLVLWLDAEDFSNNPPTSLWNDRSGKGNDFEAVGFEYTTASGSDENGKIKYDGIDDRNIRQTIDGDSLNLTEKFSLGITFVHESVDVGYIIMKNEMSSLGDCEYGIYTFGNSISFSLCSDPEYSIPAGLVLGNEYSVTITNNNGIVKLFLNGVLLYEVTKAIVYEHFNNFNIGCRSSSVDNSTGSAYSQQIIKNIIIYQNKCLSIEEVEYNDKIMRGV